LLNLKDKKTKSWLNFCIAYVLACGFVMFFISVIANEHSNLSHCGAGITIYSGVMWLYASVLFALIGVVIVITFKDIKTFLWLALIFTLTIQVLGALPKVEDGSAPSCQKIIVVPGEQ